VALVCRALLLVPCVQQYDRVLAVAVVAAMVAAAVGAVKTVPGMPAGGAYVAAAIAAVNVAIWSLMNCISSGSVRRFAVGGSTWLAP
jgi:hypothetical protein